MWILYAWVEFEFIIWVSSGSHLPSLIPAVTDAVFHCLLIYVNEHLSICSAVALNSSSADNSNSASAVSETRLTGDLLPIYRTGLFDPWIFESKITEFKRTAVGYLPQLVIMLLFWELLLEIINFDFISLIKRSMLMINHTWQIISVFFAFNSVTVLLCQWD